VKYPAAELGGILAYFDKFSELPASQSLVRRAGELITPSYTHMAGRETMKIKVPQLLWYDHIEMELNFLGGGRKWGRGWKRRML